MTRPKKGPVQAEIIADRKAREAQKEVSESFSLPLRFLPKPFGSGETVPNPPLPPTMPYEETKRMLKDTANKRRWVEAALVPLPADDEDDSYSPHPGFKHIRELPSDDYDPVVRQWNMYMNVRPNQHVILLRYPEKMPGQLYKARNGQKPLEMRIKTKSRLIEIDIPLDPHHTSYDKVRGTIYGEALRKSKILKEKGGAYGLAGGFGLGGPTQTRTAQRAAQSAADIDPTVEALLEDYDNAVKNGHVMNKMTLGGHIIQWQEGYPNLFAGAFTHDDVFFTKVDAQVNLRPQLIHLDALNDQQKSTIRMQPGADIEETEAQHLNMTIKNTEGETMESAGEAGEIAKTLKVMRAEPWQRLNWVDSETQESFDKFYDTFFTAKEKLPELSCNMTNEQWLDTISCPRIDPINPKKRHMTTHAGDEDLSSTDSESQYEFNDNYETDEEWDEEEGDEAEVDEAEGDKAEVDEAEVDKAEVDEAEVDEAEVDKGEANEEEDEWEDASEEDESEVEAGDVDAGDVHSGDVDEGDLIEGEEDEGHEEENA